MAKPPTSKRTLWLLAAALLLLLIAGLFSFLKDDPPPDDAHLQITYEKIPDEENAFTHFNLAAENLNWPKHKNERDRLAELLKENGWDQALADDILAQNEGLFDTIERGLTCPRCRLPEVTGYDTLLPYVSPLRSIATLGAIRAEHLFRQGKQEEAFEQAMLVIRLGARMQNGRGCLIVYLVGIANKEIGQRQFRRMLARTTLPPEHLMPYIPRLEACQASKEGLADAYRIEYTIAAKTTDNLAAGKHPAKGIGINFKVSPRFFLKPNRTKRLFAETFSIYMANISKTYSKATFPKYPKKHGTWFTIKTFASGNAVGIILYDMLMPSLDRVTAMKCKENCSIAATQILIALKCYKQKTGELPDSLDELVPDYLDAVPLDDFDGKPMRYSKENKVIYSIGADLVDNGGADKTDWADDEPTVEIDF